MSDDAYDIIFAGGGTTACVTAGRLAMLDPTLKILLIEAGPHTRELQDHVQPARFFRNLFLPKDTYSHHVGPFSEALGGRAAIVPSGRCVGGGSSVNFVMYTRAAASDYDDWEKLGNPGWGSDSLIPLSNKAETYQVDQGPGINHGTNGPIKVSHSGLDGNTGREFLEVAAGYDPEREIMEDPNNFTTCNAYGKWHRYVDADSGKRSDAAHHYIYCQEENKNLQILARHRVLRLIIQNGRAVGVEYVSEEDRRSSPLKISKAFASRLVVLSAGSFGSPAILERSGIGSKEVLSKCNIEQIVDLPGVGENYNDHNIVFPSYLTTDEADTVTDIFQGTEEEIEPHLTQWLADGKGIMASNGIDAGIKMRPNAKDLAELGESFTPLWNSFFANNPDKPVMWMGLVSGYLGADKSIKKAFCMGYYTEYPKAIGHVHVRSGTDPYAPLDFNPRYLEHDADVAVLRWGYKRSREFARRVKSYRGEHAPEHPKFPEGSAAAASVASGPVDINAPDIVYTAEDDKAVDDYSRANLSTTWHALGTCAMKPREKGGVVDPRLNVYGVEGLKIADLSIAPLNVAANTYNTALIIGEKAALLIAEDLGLNELQV
ncbi:alcohol oxidase-like protein [Moniliophthora roreri MCA 2997]|uniref:Alcohol oxidase-like protein n=1 Tax=Moniliophthora roreri (strain MCA 2997) TaxID=1381753 RepID=V2YJT1_MONRO|nr:alcohol oxidase-like protein [Moniliophthora roreri MCA 2997]